MVRTEEAKDILTQEQAIKVGAYTILAGAAAMAAANASDATIVSQLLKAAGETRAEVLPYLVPIIDKMAVDAVNQKL